MALFGFSCLSSLGLFANERILFMRERYAVQLYRWYLMINYYYFPGQMDTIHPSHISLPRSLFRKFFVTAGTETILWQILFDIVPLRVVPPLVFGSILYGLVGLVPSVPVFWKFLLTLVLFNLTTASVVLLISVAFSSTGVAGLAGTLIMLYKCVLASDN